MDANSFITRMRKEGFSVRQVNGHLGISSVSRLDDEQRQWVSTNKAAILATLRSVGTVLEDGQAGNDLEPANDRVVVHVPEHTVKSGNRYQCWANLVSLERRWWPVCSRGMAAGWRRLMGSSHEFPACSSFPGWAMGRDFRRFNQRG